MTELKELRKHAEDARGQAGALDEYLQEEHDWLIRLEADLRANPRRSKDDIRKAINLLRRRLGRTERTLDRDKLEKDIQELSAHLPARLRSKLEELNRPLWVALNGFVAQFSRSLGEFRQNFEELQALVDRYESERDARSKTVEFTQITGKVNETLEKLAESAKWVKSFTVSVGNYIQFLKFLEEL